MTVKMACLAPAKSGQCSSEVFMGSHCRYHYHVHNLLYQKYKRIEDKYPIIFDEPSHYQASNYLQAQKVIRLVELVIKHRREYMERCFMAEYQDRGHKLRIYVLERLVKRLKKYPVDHSVEFRDENKINISIPHQELEIENILGMDLELSEAKIYYRKGKIKECEIAPEKLLDQATKELRDGLNLIGDKEYIIRSIKNLYEPILGREITDKDLSMMVLINYLLGTYYTNFYTKMRQVEHNFSMINFGTKEKLYIFTDFSKLQHSDFVFKLKKIDEYEEQDLKIAMAFIHSAINCDLYYNSMVELLDMMEVINPEELLLAPLSYSKINTTIRNISFSIMVPFGRELLLADMKRKPEGHLYYIDKNKKKTYRLMKTVILEQIDVEGIFDQLNFGFKLFTKEIFTVYLTEQLYHDKVLEDPEKIKIYYQSYMNPLMKEVLEKNCIFYLKKYGDIFKK